MLTSLVLHILLLYALPLLKESKWQIPAQLTARLAPKPPEPVPPRQEPLPPLARPAPHPPVIRPTPAVKEMPQPSSVAAPAIPNPAILSVEPAKQGSEPAFMVSAAPSAPAPAATAPVARLEPQPVASGLDAGAVGRFRLELMDLARRYKRYPRIAQDNNWQGRVELRVTIAEDGAISSLIVKKGAGRSVLDEEAQAMIRTAKSKATIPPGLRGRAFEMDIAVDFSIQDQ